MPKMTGELVRKWLLISGWPDSDFFVNLCLEGQVVGHCVSISICCFGLLKTTTGHCIKKKMSLF